LQLSSRDGTTLLQVPSGAQACQVIEPQRPSGIGFASTCPRPSSLMPHWM
jgi:hypothetical protein